MVLENRSVSSVISISKKVIRWNTPFLQIGTTANGHRRGVFLILWISVTCSLRVVVIEKLASIVSPFVKVDARS